MTDPLDIIKRLETATAERAERALLAALAYAWEKRWIDEAAFTLACKWWETGAYESAALVLVPDPARGYSIHRMDYGPFAQAHVEDAIGNAATPALAIAAASIRAHMERADAE